MMSPELNLPFGSDISGKSVTSASLLYPKVETADVLLDWVDVARWQSCVPHALRVSDTIFQDSAVPAEYQDHVIIILVSCLFKDILQGDRSNTTFAELWGWLAVGYKVNLADQSGDTFTDLVANIVLPNENTHSYLLQADRYTAQQDSAQHLFSVNQACHMIIKGLGEPCRIIPGPLLLVF